MPCLSEPNLFGEIAGLERAERRLGVEADLEPAIFALDDVGDERRRRHGR
jgi:hypothetical protein